jgi:hypothetical protein
MPKQGATPILITEDYIPAPNVVTPDNAAAVTTSIDPTHDDAEPTGKMEQ